MCNGLVQRWFYRCVGCLSVTAANVELTQRWTGKAYGAPGRCGACGDEVESMGRVGSAGRIVKDSLRCPCDERCTGALGPNCECKCGGANHGTNMLVKVETDVGGVPVLRPIDADKAVRVAEEYRSLLGLLVAERTRLNKVKAAQGWIGDEAYSRLYRVQTVIRKAQKARTHAGRMKELGKVADQYGLVTPAAVAFALA